MGLLLGLSLVYTIFSGVPVARSMSRSEGGTGSTCVNRSSAMGWPTGD